MTLKVAARSRYVVVGSEDRKVRMWDLIALNQTPAVLVGHEGMIYGVMIPKGDRWLFTVSYSEHRAGYRGDEALRRYRFDPVLGTLAPATLMTIPSGAYGPQISSDRRWIAIK